MPTATHTPSATWRNNPASCCCINFGCGSPKTFPSTLAFIASIAGSCPEAAASVVSGTLTVGGPGPSCADLLAAGCAAEWANLCGVSWTWAIPPADIPLCGPYISGVTLACLETVASLALVGIGPPYGCVHLTFEKCVWSGFVTVARANAVKRDPAALCPQPVGGPYTHPVQSCADCTWSCVAGAGDPVCCATCPPCFTCHNCAGGTTDHCCGTGGCAQCNLPSCLSIACEQCYVPIGGGTPSDPSCPDYCEGNATFTRQYQFYLSNCSDPDDLKGCNPTACPPDDRNTGDFFIHFGGCGDDFLQVACP